jgi:hypothetical protein
VARLFGHFFHKKFDKNGLGHILGEFFRNSSGHPGSPQRWLLLEKFLFDKKVESKRSWFNGLR